MNDDANNNIADLFLTSIDKCLAKSQQNFHVYKIFCGENSVKINM